MHLWADHSGQSHKKFAMMTGETVSYTHKNTFKQSYVKVREAERYGWMARLKTQRNRKRDGQREALCLCTLHEHICPSTFKQPRTDWPLYFYREVMWSSQYNTHTNTHTETLCGTLYACLQVYTRSPALKGKVLRERRKALQLWM